MFKSRSCFSRKHEDLNAAIPILLPHVHRCRVFQLWHNCAPFYAYDFVGGVLEHLELMTDMKIAGSLGHHTILDEELPSLKTMGLRYWPCRMSLSKAICPNPRQLLVEDPMERLSASEWLSVFAAAPLLQHL